MQPLFEAEEDAAERMYGTFETALHAPLYEGALSEPAFETVDYYDDHLICRVWLENDHAQLVHVASKLEGFWNEKNGIWNVFVILRRENGWTREEMRKADELCGALATDTTREYSSEYSDDDAHIEFICYKPHQLCAVLAVIQTMFP